MMALITKGKQGYTFLKFSITLLIHILFEVFLEGISMQKLEYCSEHLVSKQYTMQKKHVDLYEDLNMIE